MPATTPAKKPAARAASQTPEEHVKTILFAMVMALAACGGGGSKEETTPDPVGGEGGETGGAGGGEAAAGPTCEEAAAGMITHMRAANAEFTEEQYEQIRSGFVESCTNDGWPEGAAACFADATSEEEARACQGQLSEEQAEKMNERIDD